MNEPGQNSETNSSNSWATIVDLTPANERPYVGSSPTNSELDLALGYNGTFRLTASDAVLNSWAG
jgi:hypothetical protein